MKTLTYVAHTIYCVIKTRVNARNNMYTNHLYWLIMWWNQAWSYIQSSSQMLKILTLDNEGQAFDR